MATRNDMSSQLEMARFWTAHMLALTKAGLVYAEELSRHLGQEPGEGDDEKNPFLRMAREMERSGFLSSLMDFSSEGSGRRLQSLTETGGAMAKTWFEMMERSLEFWERPLRGGDEKERGR